MRGTRPLTHVAVGVLVRSDGSVLLADRPAGKPYAGYWEFPGGKIERGESVAQALARELHEELGIDVRASYAWTVIDFDYPHAHVRLYFRRVFQWGGSPRPVEGQRLQFLAPGAPPPQPLLPAAVPAMRWIQLPAVVAAPAATLEEADAAGRFRCLSVAQLRAARERPRGDWIGAEVDDRADLAKAAALGCDFAYLQQRPGALGRAGRSPDAWDAIAALCADAPLPVYLSAAAADAQSLERARESGAHGLMLAMA